MNVIIIGTTIIITTVVICYTIYKIKSLNTFIKTIKTDVDLIIDAHNKYELMIKHNDDNAWKYCVSDNEYLRVLKMIKNYYNN